MSWADLLIEMDVLFVLPALFVAGFLAWQAASSVARLYRSAGASSRSGSTDASLAYGRPYVGASKFHRI